MSVQAAEAPVTFSRYCASCGIRNIDSFSSQSRQFVVHGKSGPRPLVSPRASTNGVVYIDAEPQLVVVTAERTRRAINSELGLRDFYKDKIHIIVFDSAPAGQAIGLITQVHTDGFQYNMSVPAHVESTQLFKGLLQACLLEFANRSGSRAAELPTWLIEGMLRQLQTTVVPSYVVNRKPLTVEMGYDRLGATRAYLQTNPPMTLREISFVDLSKLSSVESEQFEASAHLLVHQLLRLPDGKALLARFLQSLPHALNWQTAFYAVYHGHFSTPLQFEKWWTLNWLKFRNQQEREMWPMDVTLDKLQSLLLTSMEIRLDAGSLPQHRDTTLQEFLQLADFSTQKEILSLKSQQLILMSLNVPMQALQLWGAYQRTLEGYLQKRGLNEYQPGLKSGPEQRLQSLIKSTIKSLDELDSARAEMQGAQTPIAQRN